MTKHKYFERDLDIPLDIPYDAFLRDMSPEHADRYNRIIKRLADSLSSDIDARIMESFLSERDPKANYRRS